MSDKARVRGKISLRRLILIGLALLFLLMAATIGAIKRHLVDSLYDQGEGGRWSRGSGAAQISCFYGSWQGLSEEDIPELRYRLSEILENRAISHETLGLEENARLFALGYSGLGQVEMTGNGHTFTVNAVGTGGDFFLFHPVKLLSGSYYSEDELMRDRILIDEETAWSLFGSPDCVGKSVDIDNVPHYVAGVYKREDDRLTRAAGSSRSLAYVSYDSLRKYYAGSFVTSAYSETSAVEEDYGQLSMTGDTGTGEEGAQESGPMITCLETVLPNPVEGFAAGIMKEATGGSASVSIVDNTARFENGALFDIFMGFTSRGMQMTGISYPFWENRARAWENILSLVFMGYCLCLFIAAVIGVILIISWYRHRKWNTASLTRKAADWLYDRQSARVQIAAAQEDPSGRISAAEDKEAEEDDFDFFDDLEDMEDLRTNETVSDGPSSEEGVDTDEKPDIEKGE